MSVVKNNRMKSCNDCHGDGVSLAATFVVTVVSQDLGDAASQTCGVHSPAALTFVRLLDADIGMDVTKICMCRSVEQ